MIKANGKPIVFNFCIDEDDFIDTVFFCNEGKDGWGEFVCRAAKYGADADESTRTNWCRVMSNFERFCDDHGYRDEMADIFYEAAKAYMNERIDAEKAPFKHC